MTLLESVNAEIASQAEVFPISIGLGMLKQARYVSIVGSRNFPDLDRVDALVAILHPEACVVTGGAPGVDMAAEHAAGRRGLHCAIVRPAATVPYQPDSYLRRNSVIVMGGNVVVAFWNGESHGTKDSIVKAMSAHGLCIVVLPGEKPAIWVPRIEKQIRREKK